MTGKNNRGRGHRRGKNGAGRGHGRDNNNLSSRPSPLSTNATVLTRDYFAKRLEQAKQEAAKWRAVAEENQSRLDDAYIGFDEEYDSLSMRRLEEIKARDEELALAKQTIVEQQGALQLLQRKYSQSESARNQLLQANDALQMQLGQLQSGVPPPSRPIAAPSRNEGGEANPQVPPKEKNKKNKKVDPENPIKAATPSTENIPPNSESVGAMANSKSPVTVVKSSISVAKKATLPSPQSKNISPPKAKPHNSHSKEASKDPPQTNNSSSSSDYIPREIQAPANQPMTVTTSEMITEKAKLPPPQSKNLPPPKAEPQNSHSKAQKDRSQTNNSSSSDIPRRIPAPASQPIVVAASEEFTKTKRPPPSVQEDYVVQPLDLNQLEEFLFPVSSADNEKVVSPVFSFLSNPDQIDIGQKLVLLAKLSRRCQAEHGKAIKDKETVEQSIQIEQAAFQEIETLFQKDVEATQKLANKNLSFKKRTNLKEYKLKDNQKKKLQKKQHEINESLYKLVTQGLVDSYALSKTKAAEMALAQAEIASILLDHQDYLAVVDLALLNGLRGKLQKVTNTMASDLEQKINVQQAIVRMEKEVHETQKELDDLEKIDKQFVDEYKKRMEIIKKNKNLKFKKEGIEKMKKVKSSLEEKHAKRMVSRKEKSAKLEELSRDINLQESKLAAASKAVQNVSETLEGMYDDVAKVLASDDLKNAIAQVENFDINKSVDERGCTLLMKAVLCDDFALARWCIDDEGVDPNGMLANGMTPMMVAECFGLDRMAGLLKNFGGAVGDSKKWKQVVSRQDVASSHMLDWDGTLKIAERAAVAVNDLLDQAQSLENSETSRMQPIEREDLDALSLTFFEACMDDPTSFKAGMRRRFLLEKTIVHDLQDQDVGATWKRNFLDFASALRLGSSSSKYPILRRAVVGIRYPYEVLCSAITNEKMVLYSPYITSEVDGSFDVGILVWAICDHGNISLNKTLIESTEFLRHKVEMTQERIHGHRKFVLRLGKDMHLLDLQSTSIYTSRPMDLFIIDAEAVGLLCKTDFVPEKRVIDSDRRLANAIFRTTESERIDEENIVSESRTSMSTQLRGGAGTGKTLVMIKKIIEEEGTDKLLFVTRLPRLVSAVRARVEEERDVRNVTFSTYEDLFIRLAKAVEPANESEKQNFPFFSRVQFATIVGSSSSTFQDFINYLSARERKQMKDQRIEVATLWTAIRTIKAHLKCLTSLRPLSLEEYQSLPPVFGLDTNQRSLVYQLFEAYQEWLQLKNGKKWDEADRTLYILKHGNRVFSEKAFVSWYERYMQGLGDGLVDDEGRPRAPFFFDKVFIDEVQDFSELDLVLFLRMSRGTRSLFLAGDPAQSVEVGLRMRASTVNDVYFSSILEGSMNVKDVLQTLQMRTNHRTHASNLALAQAVRKILTRSFQVPGSRENALINGPIPEALLLEKIQLLGKPELFRGANIIFLTPDENVEQLKASCQQMGLKNDVFGVREAKGLEFDSVVLFGFFSYFEHRNAASLWRNVLLWLFSNTGITTTASSESIILGKGGRGQKLEPCDYLLSHPELEDMAMLLYTALTRARNKLYFIEVEEDGIRRKRGEKGLADFAFRCFADSKLALAKVVTKIDEGRVEMTPQEHKARGVLYVTTAIAFARESNSAREIQAKFEEARKRFLPTFGDDKDLYDQATKHMEAAVLKVQILEAMKKEFIDQGSGVYKLSRKVSQVLQFEKKLLQFLELVSWDTFLFEDLNEVLTLVLEMLEESPYAGRLGKQCFELKRDHQYWIHQIQRG